MEASCVCIHAMKVKGKLETIMFLIGINILVPIDIVAQLKSIVIANSLLFSCSTIPLQLRYVHKIFNMVYYVDLLLLARTSQCNIVLFPF
jgi:hypothetical protein